MNFIQNLDQRLDSLHLLKHPFYQAWSKGELSLSTLQTYATEYYHHVAAFPRYISGIHSLCDDIKARQILLGNLIEEEQGEQNHPALWQQFARGLGVDPKEIGTPVQYDETHHLVEGYFELTRQDYATGLGALYAYERQTPEVSQSKIAGLQKFYNIEDEKTLQFFEVHRQADEWHTAELVGLMTQLKEDDQQKADEGALAGAKLLWMFLDGMSNIAANVSA